MEVVMKNNHQTEHGTIALVGGNVTVTRDRDIGGASQSDQVGQRAKMLDLFVRVISVILIAGIMLASNISLATPGPGLAQADTDPSAYEMEALANTFDDVIDVPDQLDDNALLTSFDFPAVLAESGTKPEAIFAWVRNNTAFVQYRGVLKGLWVSCRMIKAQHT